jgi:hypothetical protein
MAKKKQTKLARKPMLSEVAAFAEGRSAGKGKKDAAVAADTSPASRFPPSGDIRLTVNLRGDLHMRLKMEAVKRRSTVGEILEELVQQHVKG